MSSPTRSLLVTYVNVDVSCSTLPLPCRLTTLSDLFSLNQLVSSPTHTSHTGSNSIIDLVFVPSHVHASSLVLPPVPSSDHKSILIEISSPSLQLSRNCPKRKIWLYPLTGFDKAVHLLSLIEWNQLLSFDLDFSWKAFKDRFLTGINLCVPSKLSHPLLATPGSIRTFES